MRAVALLVAALCLWPAWASAEVGLVLACSTADVDGRKTSESCGGKRWTMPTAGKAVAVCETTPCALNSGSIWKLVEKLTATSKVYRCSSNIPAETGGGWTATLSACPEKAWGNFTPLPPVEDPDPPPDPPVTSSPNITLTWVAPTLNTDGTALTDLAGFVLRYGRDGALDQSATIAAGTVQHLLSNLAPGEWRFTLAAVNQAGRESVPSNPVSARVEAPPPPDPKTPAPPTNVTIVIEVKQPPPPQP